MTDVTTVGFDPLSEAYARDPHGETARLRAADPLHWLAPYGLWVASSHALVRRLLHDPEVVTNDPRAWEGFPTPEPGSVQEWMFSSSLFTQDGQAHARTRRLASRAFTPASVRRMDDQVAAVVDEATDRLRGRRGVVDLVGEYALPIPNIVLSRVTGIPPKSGDEDRFRNLAAGAIRVVDPFLDPIERVEAEAQMVELVEYLRWLTAQRRAEPQADLVTDLVRAHDADDHLTNDEVVLLVVGLVLAGSETTAHAAALALRSLFAHPDQLALLRAEPERIAPSVDELLRLELPGSMLPRYALRDEVVDGRHLREGQIVFLSMIGAHRDPDVFPDPDRLDVARDTSQVIVFGRGPHHCLGAHLARTEMAHVIGGALAVLPPGTTVLDDQIRLSPPSFVFRRLDALPVDVGGP